MRHQHKRTTKPLKRVPTTRKGTPERRIIAKVIDGSREYTLHATKRLSISTSVRGASHEV